MKCVEFGSLLTCDLQFQKVLHAATNVAHSKATVLITGESGTGKELLARYIHDKSPRAQKRFVAINCAAVPEGLLESELFGYERGAFTGAINQKMGKFELASESTLLLDEISEMPLSLQAKLLRVLQEEEVDRLGGRNPIKVNLRIIATTNRDLWKMVKSHIFREDLYYRINVIPLQIPALRERPDDVVALAENFIKVSSILNSRNVTKLSLGALNKLSQWNWPGNVRELENVIERAVLMANQGEIQSEHIIIENFTSSPGTPSNSGMTAGMTIAQMERELIYKTLDKTNQNRTQAARILGISIRTLRNKLHEYRGDHG
ncbi:MAG: sigma-54 dependent transcriptional regulator [Oligoflexia bacterium]|nr:sigma-54 dependent transcriptional regulator [Oligoflexia bacterium]